MTNEMRFFFQHSLSNSLNLFPIFDRQKLRKTQKTTSTSLISPPVGPTTSEEKSWSGQHFIGTGSRSKGWKVDGHCYQGGNMGLVVFFFWGGVQGVPNSVALIFVGYLYIHIYIRLSKFALQQILFRNSWPLWDKAGTLPSLGFWGNAKKAIYRWYVFNLSLGVSTFHFLLRDAWPNSQGQRAALWDLDCLSHPICWITRIEKQVHASSQWDAPAKKKKKKHGMSVASSCDPPRLSSSKRSKRGIQEVAKWQFWSNTQPPSWKWFLARLVILPLHNSMNLQPAGWLLAMVVKEVCDIILPSAMEYMRIAAWICSLGGGNTHDT